MRTLFTLMLAIASMSYAWGQGKILWLSDDHNFGAFDENAGLAECQFRYVNLGTEPLQIISARATCGCTTPRFDKAPLMPGDTAAITVAYDPAGRPGRFSKKVYVDTTDPDNSRATLVVHGTVIGNSNTIRGRFPVEAGPMRLRQHSVEYGPVYKNKIKTLFLDGYNYTADSLRPQVLKQPKYIDVKPNPAVVPPGEQVAFCFYLRTDLCPDWGIVKDTVWIAPDAGAEAVAVPTIAIIEEDFSKLTPGQYQKAPKAVLSETTLDLERMSKADFTKTITRTIALKNTGSGSPLLVRRLSTPAQGVDARISRNEIKKGKTAEITVTIDPSAIIADMVNARITLITNDPDHPTQTIRVVGEIMN